MFLGMKSIIINPDVISSEEIDEIIAEEGHVSIHFKKSNLDRALCKTLNEISKKHGRNLHIIFNPSGTDPFDGAILHNLPNAAKLSIQSCFGAINMEALNSLENLCEFGVGGYEFTQKDILSTPSLHQVEALTLYENKNKNLDLSPLSEFKNLKYLHTEGHGRGIEAITQLYHLETLKLFRLGSKHDLSFTSELKNLTSLYIRWGGRTSIAELNAPKLKLLRIWDVVGLEELGHLGRFINLEEIEVVRQKKIKKIIVGPNPNLKEMRIVCCEGVETVRGVDTLNALHHLRLSSKLLNYEEFMKQTLPKSLKIFAFYTGPDKVDDKIQADLKSRGYREFEEDKKPWNPTIEVWSVKNLDKKT